MSCGRCHCKRVTQKLLRRSVGCGLSIDVDVVMTSARRFTQPQNRKGSYGPNHQNIVLPAEQGMIVVDLVDGRVQCVEVLYSEEIRSRLQTLLP
jgi:hypothetical protein